MPGSMTQRFPFWLTAAFLLFAATSCQPSHSAGSVDGATATSQAGTGQGTPRDLSQDEAAGGHVLRKHVGRTDDDLRDRLEREHDISASSTYADRATAEHVIGAAIAQSPDRIQSWLHRSGRRPNLVLDYDSNQPIGRTLNRGDSQSRPCSHALVVLKYVEPSYYVLTSYPECRS